MHKPASQTPRSAVRKSRHQIAWIVLADGADRECSVIDLSGRGTKLVVAVTWDLPNEFELALVQGGSHRRCNIKWRRGKMLGVQFL
jgi:hypothetical protein